VGLRPDDRTRGEVAREFRSLLAAGTRLRAAGAARNDPARRLLPRYVPRHAVTLFDTVYYLTDFFYEEGLDFFVTYVGQVPSNGGVPAALDSRIVYKDSSLVWRVASHVGRDGWIGKGDVRLVRDGESEWLVSDEDSSNLPYEIQTALDEVSRRRPKTRARDATRLVLRTAPEDRIRPYADFTRPRQRAAARGRLNRGRPIARLTRRGDPRSLRFARGFEPDFDRVLEIGLSGSRLYGGEVRKYRVLSANGLVQYQFVASPTHAWINPPQALTTEITTYGIRALGVLADEEIFIPGYEYHSMDDPDDPAAPESQIPRGWAGETCPLDPGRADASRWIEALPVIREFRRRLIGVAASNRLKGGKARRR